MAACKISRRLGYRESLYCHLHENYAGSTLASTFLPFTGELDTKTLEEALKFIYQSFPYLRSRITEKEQDWWLSSDADLDPEQFEVIHSNKWQDHVNIISTQQILSGKYLWKIILINEDNSGCLTLIMHHSISDALTMFNVIFQLLSVYTQIRKGQLPTIVPQASFQSVEYLLKDKITLDNKLKIDEKISEAIKELNPDIWFHEKNAPVQQRLTQNRFYILNSNDTKKIIAFAKNHNLSVNSVIHAGAILATVKLKQQKLSLIVGTTLNMRNYCATPIPENDLGCYVSSILTLYKNISLKEDLVQIAKDYQSQLHVNIQEQACSPDFQSLADITPQEYWKSHIKSEANYFSGPINISNMGKLNHNKNIADIKVDGIYFSTNYRVSPYAFLIAFSTFNECMLFNFIYTEPLISEHTANSFINLFLNELSLEV